MSIPLNSPIHHIKKAPDTLCKGFRFLGAFLKFCFEMTAVSTYLLAYKKVELATVNGEFPLFGIPVPYLTKTPLGSCITKRLFRGGFQPSNYLIWIELLLDFHFAI